MIEFTGYLSGVAEKHFHKRSAILGQNILLASVLIFFPVIVSLAVNWECWRLIVAYCSLFVLIPFLVRIPKSKKEKIMLTPKKIFTQDEYIVCVADRYTESRLICEAKFLRDYGEFYEIVFPFGKASDKFICQKSLLTKGSLEEFEALFDGRIII